jgi:hypothetical protein
MSLFDIDFDILVWQNMPVRLRQSKQYAWLKCLASPVRYLFGLFSTNRSNNLYTLKNNGQVCIIESVLNDIFDNTGRGIFISDPAYHDPLFIYKTPEDKPVYLDMDSEIGTHVIPAPDPPDLYTESETSLFAAAFIVHVPVSVSFDAERMKAIIDFYRLPGRNLYNVVTY